jgi:predicted nucleic acid-binding Zn ribbon protein
MNDNKDFSHAGDVMKALFSRLVPEEKVEISNFFSGWEKIAGAQTAQHVHPRDIVRNVLILETDHPLWTQQIRMRQEGLLKIIQKKYPSLEIKRIRVVIADKVPVDSKKPENKDMDDDKNIPVKKLEDLKSENNDAESQSFFELLERMRRRSDS